MSRPYREVELKFYVKGDLLQAEVDHQLRMHLNPDKETYGASDDFYYYASPRGEADFVRLRYYEHGNCEITVKTKDRESNFDRLEINVDSWPAPSARALLTEALGQPITSIYKKYSVYGLIPKSNTVVSTYTIQGKDEVFLEVEGPTEEEVNTMVKRLKMFLKLEQEPRSLYEMFVYPETQKKVSL